MALQLDYTHNNLLGETLVRDAYWVVSKFQGDDKDCLMCTVNIRADKDSETVIGSFNFNLNVDISGDSYRVQAYRYLKELDKFESAVDV